MTPSNMAAIAASLQTSLQNCSLDHHHTNTTTTTTNTAGGSGFATSSSSSSSSSISNHHSTSSSDATLELNSNTSLPYHWEQFLDLKTGEVYYINWRTGMKAKEDPRMADHYSDEEEEEEEESSYDEEGSSSESSSAASSSKKDQEGDMIGGSTVLVVAGCKSCFMYFMVAKQLEECPKCNGQLLHFNQSLHNP